MPRNKPKSAKLRVTTSATKAKLPLPKGHPQVAKPKKRVKRFPRKTEAIYTPTELRDGFGLQSCEKCGFAHNVEDHEFCARHTTKPPRAIPCGEDTGRPMRGSVDADGITLLEYEGFNGRDILKADAKAAEFATIAFYGTSPHDPPPDTSAYPWPLKWAWRVDGWIVRVRTALASKLSRLTAWVTPE